MQSRDGRREIGFMPEDKKAAGQKPCQEPHETVDGGKARARAPNQDVLPGILGKQLKAAYGELLNSPIPDAFAELIKQLESQESAERPASPEKSRREESDK
jgi:Anti-sigma factor NepR